MATFKQYLQNRWYRGMSFDDEVAYPYQFQYGMNVNVRNRKGGVTLSSMKEGFNITTGTLSGLTRIQEFTNDTAIGLKVVSNSASWTILDEEMSPEQSWTSLQNWNGLVNGDNQPVARLTPFGPYITKFRDGFFITNSSDSGLYYEAVGGGTQLDLGGLVGTLAQGGERGTIAYDYIARCAYNYADTFFLVSLAGVLLRYQPLTSDFKDTANWKIIRYFGARKWICGLSQSGNYLKIYVTDGTTTECHYAQGTFDLEESGLVQTVKYDGQLIEDCLATNGDTDYGLFYTGNGTIELREMSGYSTETIRKTKIIISGETASKLFYTNSMDVNGTLGLWARVRYRDGVVYCYTTEGIWTFTKESVGSHGWVRGGVLEWSLWDDGNTSQVDIFGKNIIALAKLDTETNPYVYNGYNKYYKMSLLDNPSRYETMGVIIGNVYTGGVGSLFKKNVSTTIVCGRTDPQLTIQADALNIGVLYRYDREYLGWTDDGFHPVKAIQPTNIYDSIFITTPDPIDTTGTAHMYNAPRNTIEYGIVLTTSNVKVSPILYEHNLIYEDSMRKYRRPVTEDTEGTEGEGS